ncbi:unnamed protein product [Malus baccata var. baccata]
MYRTAPACLHVYITMGACEHASRKEETTLTELHQLGCKMDASLSVDGEGQMVDDGGKRGGWIIFLFMIGTLVCLTLAAGGWQANLVVYLIEEFNVKSIDATQVGNVVNGCTSLFPIIGAIVADSFFGCFPVILISSCVSLLVIASLCLHSNKHTRSHSHDSSVNC